MYEILIAACFASDIDLLATHAPLEFSPRPGRQHKKLPVGIKEYLSAPNTSQLLVWVYEVALFEGYSLKSQDLWSLVPQNKSLKVLLPLDTNTSQLTMVYVLKCI